MAPLTPERFKLQLTISRKTRERLEEARDLLAHQVPNGDLAEVVERALDALVRAADFGAELVARRIAEARQSRRGRGARGLAPGLVIDHFSRTASRYPAVIINRSW